MGTRFSAQVHTGPGAHPAVCTMRIVSLSPGIKLSGRNINHSPPSSAEVEETVELYIYSPLVLHGLFYGELLLKVRKVRRSGGENEQ